MYSSSWMRVFKEDTRKRFVVSFIGGIILKKDRWNVRAHFSRENPFVEVALLYYERPDNCRKNIVINKFTMSVVRGLSL